MPPAHFLEEENIAQRTRSSGPRSRDLVSWSFSLVTLRPHVLSKSPTLPGILHDEGLGLSMFKVSAGRGACPPRLASFYPVLLFPPDTVGLKWLANPVDRTGFHLGTAESPHTVTGPARGGPPQPKAVVQLVKLPNSRALTNRPGATVYPLTAISKKVAFRPPYFLPV